MRRYDVSGRVEIGVVSKIERSVAFSFCVGWWGGECGLDFWLRHRCR